MSDVKQSPLKPAGTVVLPTILCGVAGGLVGLLLAKLKILVPLDEGFTKFVNGANFHTGEWHQVADPVSWVIAFGLAIAFSAVVLDSAYLWRRVLVGVIAIALFLGSIFSLLLWGVMISPFVMFTALLISWVFSIIYASQHSMPCEGIEIISDEVAVIEETEETPELKLEDIPETQADQVVEEVIVEAPKAEPVIETKVVKEVKPKESTENVPMPKLGKAQKSVEDVVVKAPKKK